MCGAFGLIMVGFFCPEQYSYAFAEGTDGKREYGVIYGGSGLLLATQLSGFCIILVWVSVCSLLLFIPLKLTGIFRVSNEVEQAGLDVSKHGGAAYELGLVAEGPEPAPPPAPAAKPPSAASK